MISSIKSAVATDVTTIERTKPGRGEHGQAHASRTTAATDSFQGDFRSLLNAVQSGDLTSAQSAIDSLKGEVNGTSPTYSPSSTTSASSSSTASAVSTDLKAMFDAVQAGDVEGAQSALKLFVSDARADGPNGGPNGAPAATPGRSGLKIAQAMHRHHQRLGLESIIASLFSNASPVDSTTPPVTDDTTADPTTSPATDDTTVDPTTPPAAETPTPEDTAAGLGTSPEPLVVTLGPSVELAIQPS